MLFAELVVLLFNILLVFLIGVVIVWVIPAFFQLLSEEWREWRGDIKAQHRRVQQVNDGFFTRFVTEQRTRKPYKARRYRAV
jgi:hypothetical protein